MGRRARVAPSGLEEPKTPEAPEEPEQAEVGQAPAPVTVTAATLAVPVRKSIRILTRKDEPKTTPSQQTAETNPTTQTTQPTKRTRITIAQLLQSPQPTRTTRQQAKTVYTTQQQLYEAETSLQKIDLAGQPHENHKPYEPFGQYEHHERDETSEEEELSKYSTRQHSQRQKRQPKQPSSQKKSARKQHEALIPGEYPIDAFGIFWLCPLSTCAERDLARHCFIPSLQLTGSKARPGIHGSHLDKHAKGPGKGTEKVPE